MRKLRLLLSIFLLTSGSLILKAQDKEVAVGLRAGHNAVFGGFAAASLEATHTFGNDFAVYGGIQYNTIGKTALETRPTYDISLKWGKITVESLITYSHLSSISNFTAGVGAALDSRAASARLGYYYRIYGGPGSRIQEPFNLYYEFRAHLLRKVEDWNLDFVITNCETFELERHYQPSLMAEGSFYPTGKLGISFGIGYKPVGSFHISADYYQSYLKTGVCYRW